VIRAVTFDVAGTLITPREPVGATYARVAREHGIEVEPSAVDAAFRRALRRAPPLAFPGAHDAAIGQRERAWWRDVVCTALGRGADHPGFAACFDALYAYYADGAAWRLFPDVVPALRGLRARGLRLGVVSNFDARLPGLLDRLGLASKFTAVMWSSAVGAAKPATAIFTAAVQRLGVTPTDTAHVGDDPEADVAGANAAGLVAIRLDRSGTERAAAIRSLAELGPRLDGLRRTDR
jgi:putative hydrolase of the HAD superfamily